MREKEMMTAMNRFVLAILLSISVSVTACKEKTDSTANQEKTNAVAENKKIPEKPKVNKNAEKLFNEATELKKISSYKQAFELYDKACGLKHAEACWEASEAYYSNLDPAEKAEYAKKSCDYGFAKACWRLATNYESGGHGVKKDPVQAIKLHEKACDGGYSQSCITLLYSYRDLQDYDKLEKACVKKYSVDKWDKKDDLHKIGNSCKDFAEKIYKGEKIPRDIPRAIRMYEGACEKEYTSACLTIGKMYLQGTNVSQDLVKAKKYLEARCYREITAGGEACYELGKMYEKGLGVEQDYIRAALLY